MERPDPIGSVERPDPVGFVSDGFDPDGFANPFSVANSLLNRNDMPLEAGNLLWVYGDSSLRLSVVEQWLCRAMAIR